MYYHNKINQVIATQSKPMSRKLEIAFMLFPVTDFLAFLLSFALQLYILKSYNLLSPV